MSEQTLEDDGRRQERKFPKYIFAVGGVVFAWNRLHVQLAEIFMEITRMPRQMAQEIWYSVRSDSVQRTLLLAAVVSRPAEAWSTTHPNAKEDIRILIEYINKLSAERNDAIHAPVGFASDGDVLEIYPMGNRAKRLREKDVIAEFERCRDIAIELVPYARDIAGSLRHVFDPWPETPLRYVLRANNPKHAIRIAKQGKNDIAPSSDRLRRNLNSLGFVTFAMHINQMAPNLLRKPVVPIP